MKRILILCAAMLLAACNPSAPKEKVEDAPEPPSINLSIGPAGAAGINTALPMTVEAVSAAAPDFAVAEAQEGGARVITLSHNNEVVFTLRATADGAHVREIVTTSPQAQGIYWEVVGTTGLRQVSAVQQTYCVAEPAGSVSDFLCASHENDTFWRGFKLPDWYEGARRPFDAIDVEYVYDSTLSEMRWRAPRQGASLSSGGCEMQNGVQVCVD